MPIMQLWARMNEWMSATSRRSRLSEALLAFGAFVPLQGEGWKEAYAATDSKGIVHLYHARETIGVNG